MLLFRRHLLITLVVLCSLWLAVGFLLYRSDRPSISYDDRGWGSFYFAGEFLARLIMTPGFVVARFVRTSIGSVTEWLIATFVSLILAAMIEFLGARLLRKQ